MNGLYRWISVPTVDDERGSLSILEGHACLPFDVKRLYYIYNVDSDQSRGYHAHKDLEQVFIAMSGQFQIVLDNGHESQVLTLSSPARALYVPSMTWRVLNQFTPDAVCLVLASRTYEEEDYIHDYELFRRLAQENK